MNPVNRDIAQVVQRSAAKPQTLSMVKNILMMILSLLLGILLASSLAEAQEPSSSSASVGTQSF